MDVEAVYKKSLLVFNRKMGTAYTAENPKLIFSDSWDFDPNAVGLNAGLESELLGGAGNRGVGFCSCHGRFSLRFLLSYISL